MINRLPNEYRVTAANGRSRTAHADEPTAPPGWAQRAVLASGRCIAHYPAAALAAAILTGLIVGRLVKK